MVEVTIKLIYDDEHFRNRKEKAEEIERITDALNKDTDALLIRFMEVKRRIPKKMKRYNEFSEEEKEYIRKLNYWYYVAEMSDDYNITKKEEAEHLAIFNEKYGYDFGHFAMNHYNVEDTFFR